MSERKILKYLHFEDEGMVGGVWDVELDCFG